MKKLSHILTATDFSEPSLIAVERARQLAGSQRAELTVFHGFNPTEMHALPQGFGTVLAETRTNVRQGAMQRLQQLAAQRTKQAGPRMETLLVEGCAKQALYAALNKTKAELLLVGAQGEGYWHELFLGSYISSMLSHTTIPVLIAKQTPPTEYKNLLIPVDFSDLTNAQIKCAKVIAPSARKTLLHIPQFPLEESMRLKKIGQAQINQYKKSCFIQAQMQMDALLNTTDDTRFTGKIVGQQYAPSEIISFQLENQCDLIILGKQGADFVSELLVGSVTKLVISNVSCDTLVAV